MKNSLKIMESWRRVSEHQELGGEEGEGEEEDEGWGDSYGASSRKVMVKSRARIEDLRAVNAMVIDLDLGTSTADSICLLMGYYFKLLNIITQINEYYPIQNALYPNNIVH